MAEQILAALDPRFPCLVTDVLADPGAGEWGAADELRRREDLEKEAAASP